MSGVFHGSVIQPVDSGYEDARTIFYGGVDRKPSMIVQAADVDDVVLAVKLAREKNLELAVRSGGHSVAGHGTTDGGLVIDLRRLKRLNVHTGQMHAWAETGLTAREFTVEAENHHVVVGFGDTGSVGIGGITLGGGIGYLSRLHGLTIDNVLAAEMVTADGQVIRADSKSNADLFWAIRGGGGNFGVVTRFQYRLQTSGPMYGGMLMLPATADVIRGCIQEASAAPDELSTIINIMPAPPMPMVPAEHHGRLIIMALVLYAGPPSSGEKILAPFRKLAAPIADLVRPLRYSEMFFPDNPDYHPTAVSENLFLNTVDAKCAQRIIEHLEQSDAAVRVVQLRVLGGAIDRVSNEATAYSHRGQPIMGNVAAFYSGADEKERRLAWVRELAQELRQGYTGAYVGFVGEPTAERIHDIYSQETWNRLVEVKRRYDPQNLFRRNHNISP
jgi:hypothetical protein